MLNIKQAIKLLRRDTEGSGLVEFALIFPVFMILLAGAVDYGRAYYVALDLSAAAQAGALYGSQNPTDTAGMICGTCRAERDGDLRMRMPGREFGRGLLHSAAGVRKQLCELCRCCRNGSLRSHYHAAGNAIGFNVLETRSKLLPASRDGSVFCVAREALDD
jgi:hypothetical protein